MFKGKGAKGVAYVGTTCGALHSRISIIKWNENDEISARYMAHEIAHNLGMKDDRRWCRKCGRMCRKTCMKCSSGDRCRFRRRIDRNGRRCKRGIMGFRTGWSTCSEQDFYDYHKSQKKFCLEENNK